MNSATRKKVSRLVRTKSPLAAELALARRARDEGGFSEWLYEMASIPRDRRRLHEVRAGRDVCWLDDDDEPLVTVRIATKDRPGLLVERAVSSALRQTYTNIEILVVGDHCDARTADALAEVDDPRLRYVNLGRQGDYPADPVRRWQVAGSKPMNAALLLASGSWLSPMDDDDELVDDHVEILLQHARSHRLEFVWSKTLQLGGPQAVTIGHPVFSPGCTTHGAIFYSMGLAAIPYSPSCDRLAEPFDWNLWKRFQLAGARIGYLDAVTYHTWPAGAAQYEVGS